MVWCVCMVDSFCCGFGLVCVCLMLLLLRVIFGVCVFYDVMFVLCFGCSLGGKVVFDVYFVFSLLFVCGVCLFCFCFVCLWVPCCCACVLCVCQLVVSVRYVYSFVCCLFLVCGVCLVCFVLCALCVHLLCVFCC